MDMGNKKHFFWLALIILFAGLIRIPSLTQPLGPDQGVVSVIAEGILNGELPYRDYWEMGSPAIFFTYALMFKLFGLSMRAIPVTESIWVVPTETRDASESVATAFKLLARSIWLV